MGTAPNQINVEYFFRLIYDCFVGACTVGGIGGFLAFLAHLWVWIGVLGILLSCAGIALIVYCLTRLFQLRQAEEEKYGTLHLAEDQPEKNPRFARIEELMRGESASQWREAIIEADIMMGDALTK
ncbi:MAG: hypothetical protein ACREGR_01710, partial [Minisyncoccia bacterium]